MRVGDRRQLEALEDRPELWEMASLIAVALGLEVVLMAREAQLDDVVGAAAGSRSDRPASSALGDAGDERHVCDIEFERLGASILDHVGAVTGTSENSR
jgi:hypothetical protein